MSALNLYVRADSILHLDISSVHKTKPTSID